MKKSDARMSGSTSPKYYNSHRYTPELLEKLRVDEVYTQFGKLEPYQGKAGND